MKTVRFICLLLLYFLMDCLCFGQNLFNLPLKKSYERQEPITAQDFILSFTYVTLETSPHCLVGSNPRIDITDNEIILTDRDHCLVFDKSSGSFIRKIGQIGRDPGGYRHTRGFFNENTKTFYFLGWNNNFLKYSIDGKYIGSIPIPNYNSSDPTFAPENFTYLKEKLIVCNLFNSNGLQPKLIMIFDELGNEIKSIPNRNIVKEHKITIKTKELEFYTQKNKLLYYEIYNDTIFRLNLDKTSPYILLDRGKYRTTREKQTDEQITPRFLLESERFITFSFITQQNKRYFALFDKSNSNLKVCEIVGGVANDVDGFMPFFPVSIHNEEMVALLQPYDLLKWIDEKSKSQTPISSDFKKFVATDPTSNPIIVFAKLRR